MTICNTKYTCTNRPIPTCLGIKGLVVDTCTNRYANSLSPVRLSPTDPLPQMHNALSRTWVQQAKKHFVSSSLLQWHPLKSSPSHRCHRLPSAPPLLPRHLNSNNVLNSCSAPSFGFLGLLSPRCSRSCRTLCSTSTPHAPRSSWACSPWHTSQRFVAWRRPRTI
jgi:hypothetical protein